jgi:hypothetical protein
LKMEYEYIKKKIHWRFYSELFFVNWTIELADKFIKILFS